MNKIVYFIFLLFLLPNETAYPASDHDDMCLASDPALVKSFDIPLAPDYFFRPFPNSDKIALSSDNKNYFLDLKTGSYDRVDGKYDAMPLPDEKLWIYPDGDKGLHIRKIENGKNSNELLHDKQMAGYYQSAGKLPNEAGKDRYRVIIDNGNYFMQDYELSDKHKFQKINSDPIRLCGNLSGPHSLPMVSKNGQKIALLDVNAGKTKIYSIATNGTCALDRELPISTGKVDFSFDNKSITFHTINRHEAGSTATTNGVWTERPDSRMVSNVWTMDLATGKLKQISHFTDTSALYPSFNSEGKILVRKYKTQGSTILVYDPAKELREIDPVNLNCADCNQNNVKLEKLTVLGQLYSDICVGQDTTPANEKALLALNLDKQSCNKIASSWTRNKNKVIGELMVAHGGSLLDIASISSLSMDDISKACPQEEALGVKNKSTLFKTQSPPDLNKIPTPMNRCLKCHGPHSALPMAFDNSSELKKELLRPSTVHPTLKLIDEMAARVSARSVPPPNQLGAKSLTDDETSEVIDWLDAVRQK